jgi:sarcosine oxidase subunit alpha
MLSSAVKKYADFYGVAMVKKIFFSQIMIVHMKVQLSLHKKGIKVEAIIDIEKSDQILIYKKLKN